MSEIDKLTIGEFKLIAAMLSQGNVKSEGLNDMVGEKCIIRTYSAGVWFGQIEKKSGNEVIVKNARRMWRWHAAESISLSAVAIHGITWEKSLIAQAVPSVWLEAIELIPCSETAITSIEGAENAKAN